MENIEKEMSMMTIEGLIAVLSLCGTVFSIGYVFGRNSKK